MSRVARIRNCAASCGRKYGPKQQALYNSCFSACSSPSDSSPSFAVIEQAPRAMPQRIEIVSSPVMQTASVERMPRMQFAMKYAPQQIDQVSLLPSLSSGLQSLSDTLQYSGWGRRMRRASPKKKRSTKRRVSTLRSSFYTVRKAPKGGSRRR